MSTVDTQIPVRVEVEDATSVPVVSEQQNATSFLQLAMTALRLSTTPSGDRNNNLRYRKQITLDEVSYHDTPNDCWIVLFDRVYDITSFLELHPGGHDVLLEHAGRDATIAFNGSGHSKAAYASLKMYEIGELPQKECIYRCPGKLTASLLPD
ncbi:uncharacterized protein LOC129726906 [Wyeomyia smithii]|uniref:uncharacterized protein LOC129726906 n=1 Tax=Wyeomyia smithii TaxID=174621 RepID=UPI002467F7C0|nr:uncharacterized protein LOC129726906 [Wyeomyia smithii]